MVWLLAGQQPVQAADCAGTIYLTFTPGNMAQADTIARALREEGVKATFLLANERTFRGDHALDASWGDYWRGLAAEGHVFGNHTFRHLYFKRDLPDGRVLASIDHNGPPTRLDAAELCADLQQTDDAFHALTGQRLSGLWRAPGTHLQQRVADWAAHCGWTVHSPWEAAGLFGDELPSEKYPNDKLLKQALKQFGPGTVVMMHLGIRSRKDPLAPALAPLIRGLKAKGYCFAPLAAPLRTP